MVVTTSKCVWQRIPGAAPRIIGPIANNVLVVVEGRKVVYLRDVHMVVINAWDIGPREVHNWIHGMGHKEEWEILFELFGESQRENFISDARGFKYNALLDIEAFALPH